MVAPCREGDCPSVMVSAAERSGAKSNQMAPWQRGHGCLRARFIQDYLFSRDAIARVPRLHPSTSAVALRRLALRTALGMTVDSLSLVAPCREGDCPSVMVSAAERSGAKSNQMAPWQRGHGCLRARFNQDSLFSRDAIARVPRLRPSTSAVALRRLALRTALGMTVDSL
jgi:hypothetical protein